MGLSHLYIPTETVQWGKQEFSVRGICVEDLSFLIVGYREKIDELIQRYLLLEKNRIGDDQSEMMAVVQDTFSSLMESSPTFVAQIIACAADDPEKSDMVKRLPITVQQDSLLKIFRLSFEETGGIKKFLEDLIDLMGLTRDAATVLKSPLIGTVN